MHAGTRSNDRVKSIMKSKQDDDLSTGDVEDDSFADDSSVGSGSHGSDDAGSSSGGQRHDKANRPNVLQIAARETKYVLCSKTAAYLVLLLSSVACGVFTYYFIQDEQEKQLKNDVRCSFLGLCPSSREGCIACLV